MAARSRPQSAELSVLRLRQPAAAARQAAAAGAPEYRSLLFDFKLRQPASNASASYSFAQIKRSAARPRRRAILVHLSAAGREGAALQRLRRRGRHHHPRARSRAGMVRERVHLAASGAGSRKKPACATGCARILGSEARRQRLIRRCPAHRGRSRRHHRAGRRPRQFHAFHPRRPRRHHRPSRRRPHHARAQPGALTTIGEMGLVSNSAAQRDDAGRSR